MGGVKKFVKKVVRESKGVIKDIGKGAIGLAGKGLTELGVIDEPNMLQAEQRQGVSREDTGGETLKIRQKKKKKGNRKNMISSKKSTTKNQGLNVNKTKANI